ncbi:MAG: ABC-F family ATP-binding cassette domain-containing protein [Dehalococcoidia bacterium]
MELIRLQNVSKDFGHRAVLLDVSLRINSGQKLGMIGPNGGGKTSTLRLIAGEDTPSGGAITRAPGLRIGYVPQQVYADDDETVLDHVLAENLRAAAALRGREEQLARAQGDGVAAAVEAYEQARAAYEGTGGDRLPARARGMLDALGLPGRVEQRVGTLSGGEKNVLSLTRALLAEPDLLLLDEPGNHLDFAGLDWLEQFLRKFRGAVLVVSHNRYLLDRVAEGILDLHGGRVQAYAGNYTSYRATLLREKVAQQADYVANQKRLLQLEELVKRFEQIARSRPDPAWGKRLRARRSQLEREKRQAVEKPEEEASSLRLALRGRRSQADVALQLRGYSKAFGNRRLFEGAEVDIACGERVALVGPNGSGKTTLLRDIVREGAWDDAVIRIGPSLRVGYCAQEQEVLDEDRTVFEEMFREGLSRGRAHGVLAQFLFGANDLDKRIGNLSGGERNRLQLAKLMVREPDFLILDEPTNHLDIPACEAIEEALAEFKGTILAVSHDRYFLDKVGERVVEVRNRKLESYAGNFSEYWQQRRATTAVARPAARVATRGRERERRATAASAVKDNPRVRALQAEIEAAEGERVALERRVSEAFTRGDHREGTRAAAQLERHNARLEDLYSRWVREAGG